MKKSHFSKFTVEFGDNAVADLHRRLDATRWPEMPFATRWSAGTDDQVLRDLARYWRHEYDWADVQRRLNLLDHRRGPVDGENLHFVHYPASSGSQPFPLLLLHGWPGSFVEFSKAAPILAAGKNGQPGFDLIVPSLPGFVVSDAPGAPGMNPTRIAQRLHQLMTDLGYDAYGVQGGDWGGPIARELARQYPGAIAGLHLNIAPWISLPANRELTPEEREYTAYRQQFDAGETAYWSIQGTKPQSLCYGLQDSPVGLLAWLLEKYWAWSEHGDDLWQTIEREDVLTTVTLYWLTGRILSAARIYHEAWPWWPGDLSRVVVPTGYARYPKEPWCSPRSFIEPLFNLVHYVEMPRGGHFAATEQPKLFAADVATFFTRPNTVAAM